MIKKKKSITNKQKIKRLEDKYNLKNDTLANYLIMEDITYHGKDPNEILKKLYQSKHSKTLIVKLNEDSQEVVSTFKITDLSKYIGEFTNLNIGPIKLSPKIFKKYSSFLIEKGLRGIFKVEINTMGKDAKYYISEVTPLQYLDKDKELKSWVENREDYSTKKWLDLILETLGFNPKELLYREKVLNLIRLIPFCEKNYNLLELGPRQVGKTYHYKRGAPYSNVISGQITSSNTFYNSKEKIDGFIINNDVVVFDEFTKKIDDKSLAAPLKEFMNDGSTVVSKKIQCDTSLVFQGNINEVEKKIESENEWFFDKFDSQFKDTAFFDRFHYMIPSWGLRKMQKKLYSEDVEYSVEKLFFILNSLRDDNGFNDILDRNNFKTNGTERGERSIRKTVTGLLKILHPHKEVTSEELSTYIYLALEGRYLIERQLQKESPNEFKELISSFSISIEDEEETYDLHDPSENKLEMMLYNGFIGNVGSKKEITILPHRIIVNSKKKLKKIALDSLGVEENKKEVEIYQNGKKKFFLKVRYDKNDYSEIEHEVNEILEFESKKDLEDLYTKYIFNTDNFKYFLSKDPVRNYLYDYKIDIDNIENLTYFEDEFPLFSFFSPTNKKVIACKNEECYSEDLFINEDFMYECEDCSTKYHLHEGESLLISKKTLKNKQKKFKNK